jgi:glycosyltransferase involved in cell wall biosynthesis
MLDKSNGILVFFHCPANTGYAIKTLELRFFEAVSRLYPLGQIHFAWPEMSSGISSFLLGRVKHTLCFDSSSEDVDHLESVEAYIREHRIDVGFGFDQPVSRKSYRYLRRAGVKTLISYQGAPMSDLKSGITLLLKRLQVLLTPFKPDHYIFESEAMAETGYNGRGIYRDKISIVYLGVDTEKYRPNTNERVYVYHEFGIPEDRKVIFYSGHMEERKGVRVIMQAADYLINKKRFRDIHFLITGNRLGEEKRFLSMLEGTQAISYVTFGGYREDIPQLHRGCYAGVIASTGWDSFTISSIEMASSGLPLIVSALQGLKETIEDRVSGLFFKPGDHLALANCIQSLVSNPAQRDRMSANARKRVIENFSRERQVECLENTIKMLVKSR